MLRYVLMTKLSVAILYGFGEGKWHGRGLRKALQTTGFTMAASPETADIIIAHSGGMYSLPKNTAGKTIFIIAPSCGKARRTWFHTQGAKVWQDMRYFLHSGLFIQWFYKSFWNGVYVIAQIPRLSTLWHIHQEHQAGLPITGTSTTIITFKDDPWSGYITTQELAKHPTYTFIEMDAIHDDIWLRPELYVELLQQHHR